MSSADTALSGVSDAYTYKFPVHYTYIAIGSLATWLNIGVLVVYLSAHKFLTKFTLFIGLTIAELINSLAFLLTGIF
jgi:hypothetical protein